MLNSLAVSICKCVNLRISVYLHVCPSICLALSLSPSPLPPPTLSLSLPLSLSLSPSLPSSLPPSLPPASFSQRCPVVHSSEWLARQNVSKKRDNIKLFVTQKSISGCILDLPLTPALTLISPHGPSPPPPPSGPAKDQIIYKAGRVLETLPGQVDIFSNVTRYSTAWSDVSGGVGLTSL